MIQKIRAGNRITHVWAIVYKDAPVDLTKIRTGAKLTRSIFNKSEVIPFEVVDTNKIRSQHLLYTTGVYNLKFECAIYDESVQGNYRECTVDANVFEIVDMSEKADVSSEYVSTSDIAVGLQGKNAYEVWLETHEGTIDDYEAWLKQPASDAAASVQSVEQAVEGAEALRVTSEQGRETAEGLRVAALEYVF